MLLFDLYGEPSVLQEGVIPARTGAAALLVAVTEAILVLVRRPHTLAGTTTLLVSFGLFTAPRQLASPIVGIALVTAAPSQPRLRCPGAPPGQRVSKFTLRQ